MEPSSEGANGTTGWSSRLTLDRTAHCVVQLLLPREGVVILPMHFMSGWGQTNPFDVPEAEWYKGGSVRSRPFPSVGRDSDLALSACVAPKPFRWQI